MGLSNEKKENEGDDDDDDDDFSVLSLRLDSGIGESCVGSVARLTIMNWAKVMISPVGTYQKEQIKAAQNIKHFQKFIIKR